MWNRWTHNLPAHRLVDTKVAWTSRIWAPVSFARSAITAAWSTKFASLLELAEACDIPVRWSCRTGVCHTCMTGLIVGAIAYQPEPLERPAPGNVLVCCSQPD